MPRINRPVFDEDPALAVQAPQGMNAAVGAEPHRIYEQGYVAQAFDYVKDHNMAYRQRFDRKNFSADLVLKHRTWAFEQALRLANSGRLGKADFTDLLTTAKAIEDYIFSNDDNNNKSTGSAEIKSN